MENRSYDEVIGSADAPYLTKLGRRCGLATNFHNITHPSLPNYIAATSGLGYRGLALFGSNCDPSRSCSTKAKSIFEQAPSWRAYQESMPAPCTRMNAGLYAVRHNPPPYYRDLRGCRKRDVPFTRLEGDLAQGRLPAFSFITPNLCNDTHDCPVAQGDGWLAEHVPAILDSSAYGKGTVALFITYDEGYGDVTHRCARNTTAPDCHIPTVVVSPTTPAHTESARLFNLYSLLRTSEEILGLRPLRKARLAPSMAAAFGLPS
jgi:phospholipase C